MPKALKEKLLETYENQPVSVKDLEARRQNIPVDLNAPVEEKIENKEDEPVVVEEKKNVNESVEENNVENVEIKEEDPKPEEVENSENSEEKAEDKKAPINDIEAYRALYEQENLVEYHAIIDEDQAQKILEEKQREYQAIMDAELGVNKEVEPPVNEEEPSNFFGKVANFFKGK